MNAPQNQSKPITFKKAVKIAIKLRLGLCGPSGSGKTFTALVIATGLAQALEKILGRKVRIVVIDSERDSALRYADQFDFDHCSLDRYSVGDYLDAIQAAEREGYDIIIVDSGSHEWMGTGGILEEVDRTKKAADRANRHNLSPWIDATPRHNAFIDGILRTNAHMIVTFRSKTEWLIESGKKPEKVGLAPITRDGVEYEFDIFGELAIDNKLSVDKTRCSALKGKTIDLVGYKFGHDLAVWLGSDEAAAPRQPVPPPTNVITHPTAAAKPSSGAAQNASPAPAPATPPAQHPRVAAAVARLQAAASILGSEECKRLVGSPRKVGELEHAAGVLEREIAGRKRAEEERRKAEAEEAAEGVEGDVWSDDAVDDVPWSTEAKTAATPSMGGDAAAAVSVGTSEESAQAPAEAGQEHTTFADLSKAKRDPAQVSFEKEIYGLKELLAEAVGADKAEWIWSHDATLRRLPKSGKDIVERRKEYITAAHAVMIQHAPRAKAEPGSEG